MKPHEIEARSMEIITGEMDESRLNFYSEAELKVVKRCIHTSADFEYQYSLTFRHDPIQKAMTAIQNGAAIITDTSMAAAGMNKPKLAKFGAEVFHFITDEYVVEESRRRGVTRSAVAMEVGAGLGKSRELIFAVGNAPTALIRLRELMDEGLKPAVIIGAPVGFVNVVESKEMIAVTDVPSIIPMGRKGGSNIAAAIVNAILYQMQDAEIQENTAILVKR